MAFNDGNCKPCGAGNFNIVCGGFICACVCGGDHGQIKPLRCLGTVKAYAALRASDLPRVTPPKRVADGQGGCYGIMALQCSRNPVDHLMA